jgi:HAD superfamily hydrolase (TIGR01549 family)
MLKAVLLDAGGTLIHPDHGFLLELLAEEGIEADEAGYRAARRKADGLVADMLRSDPPADDTARIRAWFATILTSLGLPEDRLQSAAGRIRERHEQARLWIRPEPGTLETLRDLRAAGLRLAVVSNADGRVDRFLSAAGLADELEFILDSGTVGIEKPDPRIFELALDRLGLEPHEVVYVGDSWEIDVIGARRAGIRPIYISETGRDGATCIAGIPELPMALGLEPAGAD